MKKLVLLLPILLFIVQCSLLIAQSPQAINYQAVARDKAGKILADSTVNLRISVLKGAMDAAAVYTETQSLTTNKLGVINIKIGNGVAVTGKFADIKWGSDKYFLKMEMDIDNSGYIVTGVSQLLSVPYSLYANEAGSLNLTDSTGKKWQIKIGKDGKLKTCPELTPANAGVDQLEIDGTTVTLDGNAPTTGETGKWSIVSGTGGVITAPTNPKSTFTGKAGRTYKLTWTLTNTCGSNSDQVTISFKGNMVFVQGGTFLMGDDNSTYANQKPAHLVTLTNSFWISKFELTQGEYVEVMGTNPSAFKNDNNPVETVSWWDAVKYCNKRSMLEGIPVCYSYNGDTLPDNWTDNPMDDSKIICNWSAKGYRLPTEAEWEFSAKGGVKSVGYANHAYYTYSGSNIATEVAWYNDDPDEHPKKSTTVVGTLKANELGLYDMSGNVIELVWDFYLSTYTTDSLYNPTGPLSGTGRYYRGGYWNISFNEINTTYRWAVKSFNKSNNLGFRICKTN